MPLRGRQTYRECFVGIVGQRGVGKTSIANRVFEQYFIADEDYNYGMCASVPIRFAAIKEQTKLTAIWMKLGVEDPTYEGPPRRMYVVDKKDVMLDSFEFEDDPGVNQMSKIIAIKCDGFLMVFSLADRDSLEKLRFYHKATLDARDQKPFHGIIMGNKCDSTGSRVVDKQEAEAMAQELGCKYFEISAKEDINVDDAMRELVREKWRQDEIVIGAASATEPRGESDKQGGPKGKFKLVQKMGWMREKLRGSRKS